MSDTKIVKRGFEFTHLRWLEADLKTPVKAVVTRVAKGVVYYRPKSGGAPFKQDLDKFIDIYVNGNHNDFR